MAATRITVPHEDWVQLTNGETSGSIFHIKGSSVYYAESTTKPSTTLDTVAISEATAPDESAYYYGLEDGMFVWAYGRFGSADITVSPA